MLQAQEGIATIDNCTLETNAAAHAAHGMHITSKSSVTMSSSHFNGNSAAYRESVLIPKMVYSSLRKAHSETVHPSIKVE